MKRTIVLAFTLLLTFACKDTTSNSKESFEPSETERTEKQNDGLTLLKGDFIFHNGAAVLQTHKDFYGVIINDKVHELNDMVKKYKSAETDNVTVEIRGRVSQKEDPVIQWQNKLEIVEILNVAAVQTDANQTIK